MLSHPQPQPFAHLFFCNPLGFMTGPGCGISPYQYHWFYFWQPTLTLVGVQWSIPQSGCSHVYMFNPFYGSLLFTLCDHLRFGLSMLIQSPGVALTAGTTWDRKWNPAGKQPARQPHYQRFGSHCRFYNCIRIMDGIGHDPKFSVFGHLLATRSGFLVVFGAGIST